MSTDQTSSPVASTGAEVALVAPRSTSKMDFVPRAPRNLAESGLRDTDIEASILKMLLMHGSASSKELARQIKVPGEFIRESLDRLRAELLVAHRGTTDLIDFVFQLTESGTARAKQFSVLNSYCGAAPVTIEAYIDSVHRQTVNHQVVRLEEFRKALNGLSLDSETQSQLAQAVNAGRGLLLYGAPGNGKTSVATRLSACYPDSIWIPRCITVGGAIIRIYDASVHEALDPEENGFAGRMDDIDHRWVLIKRPTIVVGGELMMEHLEIQEKDGSTVLEAPVQMKSNGGTLVIDDFGRQRVSPTEILNRWIVPLERHEDFLSLPNGRQIQVPFQQILVLSTNLEPRDLVDEAFLRRIPYKVELKSPSPEQFRPVFEAVAKQHNMVIEEGALDYLLNTYYRDGQRELRYCHGRDFVYQISNLCQLHELPMRVSQRNIELVAKNYFGDEERFAQP